MQVRVYDYIPFFIKVFSASARLKFHQNRLTVSNNSSGSLHLSVYGIAGILWHNLFFALILGIAGAVLIVYGGLKAIVKILHLEILKGPHTYNLIRREMTDKIVFGLEFLIAADIL